MLCFVCLLSAMRKGQHFNKSTGCEEPSPDTSNKRIWGMSNCCWCCFCMGVIMLLNWSLLLISSLTGFFPQWLAKMKGLYGDGGMDGGCTNNNCKYCWCHHYVQRLQQFDDCLLTCCFFCFFIIDNNRPRRWKQQQRQQWQQQRPTKQRWPKTKRWMVDIPTIVVSTVHQTCAEIKPTWWMFAHMLLHYFSLWLQMMARWWATKMSNNEEVPRRLRQEERLLVAKADSHVELNPFFEDAGRGQRD